MQIFNSFEAIIKMIIVLVHRIFNLGLLSFMNIVSCSQPTFAYIARKEKSIERRYSLVVDIFEKHAYN